MSWTKESLRKHYKNAFSNVDNRKASIICNEETWRNRFDGNPENKEAAFCAQICREILAEDYGEFELLWKFGGAGDITTGPLIASLLADKTPIFITE